MPDQSSSFFDPQHPLHNAGRKVIFGVLLSALVVYYYVHRYSKGLEVIHALGRVSPVILLGMVILELLYLFFQGGLLRGVYRVIGHQRDQAYLTAMYIGMNLVNTVAPVAGLSGSIYMMHFEKQRGLSRSDTLLINFLYYVTDYFVFLVVLMLGLLYLLFTGGITHTILVTSLIFAGFCLAVLAGGVAIFSHPHALHRFVSSINKFVGKFMGRKKPPIPESRLVSFAQNARETWKASHGRLSRLGSSIVCAFCLHLTCLLMLELAFRSVGLHESAQILAAGYTVATLLNIVSPTPAGIGVAEGGMTAVFSALGVPVGEALVVSLLYRLIFVWVPLLLGLVALHVLPRLADKQPVQPVY